MGERLPIVLELWEVVLEAEESYWASMCRARVGVWMGFWGGGGVGSAIGVRKWVFCVIIGLTVGF